MEKILSFEEKFDKLKEISEKIESATLSLDATMALYEEGIKLAKALQNELDLAKEKFAKLHNLDEIIDESK